MLNDVMEIRSGGETLVLYRDDQAVCVFCKPLVYVHEWKCWSIAVSVTLFGYAMGRVKLTF